MLPDSTFLYGGTKDYIIRPTPDGTVSQANTEDVARKAVILEPVNNIDALEWTSYLAAIDSVGTAGSPITGLQQMNYSWHLRGGLRGINLDGSGSLSPQTSEGDLFAYKLDYQTVGAFDGNIGRQSWKNDTEGQRSYSFAYDRAKRLTSATYNGNNSENFSLPNLSYDKNGNIQSLQRNGKLTAGSFGLMDDLSYTYSGNRLTSVSDNISGDHEVDLAPTGGGAYTYWLNGALKSDANEGISLIEYDTFLDQPKQITLTDGRWIKYFYDGTGTLLKTQYSTGEVWEFAGEFVYKNGQLYQVNDEEGRLLYSDGNYNYEFDYKDHLGNTRVSFKADGNRLVKTAETAFDPWGVRLVGVGGVNGVQNRWEMQGHEKEETFGLNRINFGARTLNPTIGSFDRIDRFSEKYYSLSSFQYAANNPGNYIDINGDSLWIRQNRKNNLLYLNGQLYNSNGSKYEGKVKGFLQKTLNALNEINSTDDGSSALSELESSRFSYVIRKGGNETVPDNKALSGLRDVAPQFASKAGSGGTIYWNPNDRTGGIDVNNSTSRPSFIGLAHEVGHAIGSIRGSNDWRSYSPNSLHLNTITNDDFAAMHFENQIRTAHGLSLREFYTKDSSGNGFMRAIVPSSTIGVNLYNYQSRKYIYEN